MTRICTLLASLVLIGCSEQNAPYNNADSLEIINKSEYHNGKILYTIRAVSDSNFKSDWHSDWEGNKTISYFYSTDRSLDVGDKVKIVKKQ